MARVTTKIHAPRTASPHDDLDVVAELAVPLIDLGLEVPHGTVTFRANGEVVCADVLVDRSDASCFVPEVPTGRLRLTAHFTPEDFSTLHPSTSGPKTVLVGTRPVLKGPDRVRTRVGQSVDLTWRASGDPTPRVRKVGGRLPAGLGISYARGRAMVTGRAGPGTAGVYHLRLKATNLVGHDARRVTLVVERR